jgi:hypothetical protein
MDLRLYRCPNCDIEMTEVRIITPWGWRSHDGTWYDIYPEDLNELSAYGIIDDSTVLVKVLLCRRCGILRFLRYDEGEAGYGD